MGQFKAKKAVLLFDNHKQVHVNSDKATDEEILSILAGQPGAIKYFDGPADWEDQVKEFQKKREAAAKAKKDKVAPKTPAKAPAKTSQTLAQALGVDNLEAANGEISKGTKKGLVTLAKKIGVEFKNNETVEEMKAALQEVAAKEFEKEKDAGIMVGDTFKAFKDMSDEELGQVATEAGVEIAETDDREAIIAKLGELAE